MSLVEEMFRRFTERQAHFFNSLNDDDRQMLAELDDKYAELSITGTDGCVLYFQYKGQRLNLLDSPPEVPDEELDHFYLDGDLINYPGGDEVFFDVIDGSLTPRAAISRKYFRANTNHILYDTEEFAQAFEKFLNEMRRVLGVSSAS